MKIDKIKMVNVKGHTLDQNFSGLDLFIGNNGSGKSKNLQALSIAMVGYVPGYNKTEESNFKFASDDSMTVGLSTDSGFKCERTFFKKSTEHRDGTEDISYKQEVSVLPDKGENNNTQRLSRIQDELGNFPVMLDFSQFLSMTETKKKEFILGLGGFQSSWNADRIKDYLKKNLLTEELKTINKSQYEIMAEAINDVTEQFIDTDIQEATKLLYTYSADKLSYWKKELKRLEGTVLKLAQLKNSTTVTDRDLPQNEKQLETLQAELIKIEKEISALEVKNKAAAANLVKIENLRKQLETVKTELPKEKAVDLEKLIKAEEVKIKNIDYSKEIEVLKLKLTEDRKALEKEQDKLNKVKENGTAITTEIKTLEDIISKIKNQHGKCAIDSRIPCKQNFDEFIKDTEKSIKELSVKKESLNKDYQVKEKEIATLKKGIEDADKKKEDLSAKEKSQNTINENARKTIINLQNRLNTVTNFENLKAQKIKTLTEDIEKLEKEPKAVTIDLNTKQQKEEEIKKLKSTIDLQKTARTTFTNYKNSQVEKAKAEMNQLAYKSLTDALSAKGVQGEILKELLAPMKQEIQLNLQILGIDNEFYFSTQNEVGTEIFEFGWINDKGRKICFNTLSDGEKILLLSSIVVAFMEQAETPCKVLMIDELNNLDNINIERVAKGLATFTMLGKLDNAILAGNIKTQSEVNTFLYEGFSVWNMNDNTKIDSENLEKVS